MTPEEALEWLRGERSNWNTIRAGDFTTEAFATTERADAGSTERAYWMVRAHREGLITEEETGE